MGALLKLALSGMGSRATQPEALTKLGRKLYAGSLGLVTFCLYTAWRREVAPGQFPIPGLTKVAAPVFSRLSELPGLQPFKAIIPDLSLQDTATDATGSTATGGAPPILGASPPGQAGFLGGKAPNLIELGHLAEQRFGLRATENPLFGGVHPVHVAGSYHYKGRAIDFVGPTKNLTVWAAFLANNYGSRITELFWRGPGWINIKNGVKQGKDFVDDHTDHVHLAI